MKLGFGFLLAILSVAPTYGKTFEISEEPVDVNVPSSGSKWFLKSCVCKVGTDTETISSTGEPSGKYLLTDFSDFQGGIYVRWDIRKNKGSRLDILKIPTSGQIPTPIKGQVSIFKLYEVDKTFVLRDYRDYIEMPIEYAEESTINAAYSEPSVGVMFCAGVYSSQTAEEYPRLDTLEIYSRVVANKYKTFNVETVSLPTEVPPVFIPKYDSLFSNLSKVKSYTKSIGSCKMKFYFFVGHGKGQTNGVQRGFCLGPRRYFTRTELFNSLNTDDNTKNILVMDFCNSGEYASGVPRNTLVLTSCKANEMSTTPKKNRSAIFNDASNVSAFSQYLYCWIMGNQDKTYDNLKTYIDSTPLYVKSKNPNEYPVHQRITDPEFNIVMHPLCVAGNGFDMTKKILE